MDTTSASLLERLRTPDPAAWARFVPLYAPLLYDWAGRLGLQSADAADLVQDVFAALLRELPKFRYDPGRSFRGWLRVVARNAWLTAARKHAAVAAAAPGEPAAPDDAEMFAEDEYRQALTRRAMHVMQADFKPETWQACWEMVANGRPAGEVAAELGLTVGAVYAAKFRVLARLRTELAGLLD